MSLYELSCRLHALVVFRALLSDPVVRALLAYLDCRVAGEEGKAPDLYATFVSRLFSARCEVWSRYVQELVGDDENAYTHCIGSGEEPSSVLQRNVDAELETLQALAALTPDTLRDGLSFVGYWPEFGVEAVDIATEYRHRVSNIGRYGYGMYARFRMFCIDGDGHIAPVHSPDPVRLSELVDYERERRIILDNTRALLAGKPAANILLSGDAGTGKSSTVKAIVNELYREGLRILEVRKEQLRAIPAILAELSDNPLKFILFIDDLSFRSDDDNYSALKAILEGSVSSKASNTVIYATSNRRHLVREKFSDREGDDVHLNDTLQEMLSLSERFGLQVTFKRPDKKTYLDIVRHLVQERGIEMDAAELELAAERFALARGGRSARAARQFADSLVTEVSI